ASWSNAIKNGSANPARSARNAIATRFRNLASSAQDNSTACSLFSASNAARSEDDSSSSLEVTLVTDVAVINKCGTSPHPAISSMSFRLLSVGCAAAGAQLYSESGIGTT